MRSEITATKTIANDEGKGFSVGVEEVDGLGMIPELDGDDVGIGDIEDGDELGDNVGLGDGFRDGCTDGDKLGDDDDDDSGVGTEGGEFDKLGDEVAVKLHRGSFGSNGSDSSVGGGVVVSWDKLRRVTYGIKPF